MAEKIYFNGLNGKASKYGVRLSGKAERVIEEIRKHTNSGGYINLEIQPRREPDKYGNTHTVIVDTWEPKPKAEQPQKAEQTGPSDDLPF